VGTYVTNGGNTYYCYAPNTNQAPPNYSFWLKVGAGSIDIYSCVNECLLGGSGQGFFTTIFSGNPQTWVPLFMTYMLGVDPNARKYEINNGHGELANDNAQRTGVTNLFSHILGVTAFPAGKLNMGYEGHVVCSQM